MPDVYKRQAYDREKFWFQGGFIQNAIFNEDMIFAGKAVMEDDYAIALSLIHIFISPFLTIISIFPVCVKLRGIFIQYCTGNGDLNIVLCHEPGRYKISSFTEQDHELCSVWRIRTVYCIWTSKGRSWHLCRCV